MKRTYLFFVALLFSSWVLANSVSTLRPAAITEESTPPPLLNYINDDEKKQRNYPMQPPVIPHRIDGYQTDIYANTCLSCHARKRTSESQAPMVSVTHYMDRHGNFRADVSPRRYFCKQCHVPQTAAKPTVENIFIDMDLLSTSEAE